MMPVMDGPELIPGRLRSDPATAGIPIMASTGDPNLAGAADVAHIQSIVAAGPRRRSERLPQGRTRPLESDAHRHRRAGPGAQRRPGTRVGGGRGWGTWHRQDHPGPADLLCEGHRRHKAVYYSTVSEPHTKLVRHLVPFDFFDLDSPGRNRRVHPPGRLPAFRERERGRAGATDRGDRPESAGGRARRRGGGQHQDAARLCRRAPVALRALRPDQPGTPHRHGAAGPG